jgi:hypothetical protein
MRLGTLVFADPCASVADGVLNVTPLPENAMVLVTGTPTWAILNDDTDAEIGDMSVGVEGSGEAVELLNTSLVAGGLIIPTSIAFAFG